MSEHQPSQAEKIAEVDVSTLGTETLAGDIRDELLELYKRTKNILPWDKLPAAEQRTIVTMVQNCADGLVRRACQMVADQGLESIPAEIVDFRVKGSTLEMKVKASAHDQSVLFAHHHSRVVLTSADSHKFEGERKTATSHVAPDQKNWVEDDEIDQESGEPAAEPTSGAEEAPEEESQGDDDPRLLTMPEGLSARVRPEFDAGARAAQRNEPKDNNPHKPRTKKSQAWNAGWEAWTEREKARAAQQDAEPGPEEPTEDGGASFEEDGPEDLNRQEGRPSTEDDEDDGSEDPDPGSDDVDPIG